MNAACTFSNTVSFGKMLVRWNERPMPRRQTSCGASPVMSRPFRTTVPASGRRSPVTRLKNVVLPAPFGPMIAAIWPRATPSVTPATAWKPSNALRTLCTSSTQCPRQPAADDASGADEGDELVAPHVDADELGALGVLADRREDAPER